MDETYNQTFVIQLASGNKLLMSNQQQTYVVLNRGVSQKSKDGNDTPTYTLVK